MAKRKKFSPIAAFFVALLMLAIGAVGGLMAFLEVNEPTDTDTDVVGVYVSGDLEIHFLELGNKYTGDCTYINAGGIDILIDAGSKTSSIPTISALF